MKDSEALGRQQQVVRSGPAAGILVTALAVTFPVFVAPWPNWALAQTYPAKSIKLIVPFGPGGPPDIVGRIMAQHLTAGLGQQVIVDNRPGAGGTIGAAAAAKSPSDGYTLFLASTTTLSIAPSLYTNPGYDPRASFASVSLIVTTPFLVFVHPSVPAESLKELIKLAKAKPGQLNFGSPGSGTPLHIAGEMFKTTTGVNIVHVPYKTISQTTTDFIAGQTQIMFQQLASLDQYLRAGKVRALAVASEKRHAQLPNVPTAAEAGVPGFVVTAWIGLVAPAGTPPDVIRRLNMEVLKALQAKEVRDPLFNQGFDPTGNSPEQFSAFIAGETAKWSRAVKTSGAKVD